VGKESFAAVRRKKTMAVVRRWYHPFGIYRSLVLRPRLYGAALAGIAAYFICPAIWPGTVRLSIAWDVGGLIYLMFALHLMATCPVNHIKTIAAEGDDSRVVILALILLSIGASFISIAQLIAHAKQPEVGDLEKALLAALAITTIIISWSVTQIAFTLHYAHEYYMPDDHGDAKGGLQFAGSDEPDYWDFLYFATSIGATSQTSDTAIGSHSLRRLATLHAVISFFYNTAVLALTVNIAASLA
jgi:uncharacterized membrane protein